MAAIRKDATNSLSDRQKIPRDQQLKLLIAFFQLVKPPEAPKSKKKGFHRTCCKASCCKKYECNKMDDEEKAIRLYEARIERDIQELEKEISRLYESKLVLQRLQREARRRGRSEPVVKRRNSADRVMIETAIRRTLYGKPSVKSRDIYDRVKKVSHDLKHSTFRSHLHRMKEKGLILQHGRGAWRLA